MIKVLDNSTIEWILQGIKRWAKELFVNDVTYSDGKLWKWKYRNGVQQQKIEVFDSGQIVSDGGGLTEEMLGEPNGVCPLDQNGLVDPQFIPSFVDNVFEGYMYNGVFYEDIQHTTPIDPETGKIYIDLATNRMYRWDGTSYVEMTIDISNLQRMFYAPIPDGIGGLPQETISELRVGDIISEPATEDENPDTLYYEVVRTDDAHRYLMQITSDAHSQYGVDLQLASLVFELDNNEWVLVGGNNYNLSRKADMVYGAVSGNLAGLDSDGNLTDSGYSPSDFLTQSDIHEYTIAEDQTPTEGYLKTYRLKKDGNDIQGSSPINIPKDFLVRSGSVIDVVEYNGQYYDSTDTGHTNPLPVSSEGKYIDFVVNVSSGTATDEHIYIAVDDLVDVYTAGNGIDISNSNVVSIKIDSTNSNGLSVGSNGIALATAVASSSGTGGSSGAMSATDKEKLDGIESGAEANVQSDWNETDNTSDAYIRNKPTIPDISGKADKVQNAVSGNLAGLDSTGNLTDSGFSPSDFLETSVDITYSELVTLKNGGNLVPGAKYRITDYTCTTTQANTQSAGHAFDIIVVADSETELNETAWAAIHSGDTYFTNCDLGSWKLKYCLENDVTRFAWADSANGKGVVYYMKDDLENECTYDFKNIQFKRWEITSCQDCPNLVVNNAGNTHGIYYGAKNGDGGNVVDGATYGSNSDWFYTFSLKDDATGTIYDFSVETHRGIFNGNGDIAFCKGNRISFYRKTVEYLGVKYTAMRLNNIVFIDALSNIQSQTHDSIGLCISNIFEEHCYDSTFGPSCQCMFFAADSCYNTAGSECSGNTFGSYCRGNKFGNYFQVNSAELYFMNNSFGSYCLGNRFDNYYLYNVSSDNFETNQFGNYCYSNTFGIHCYSNVFGNDCHDNTFGTYFNSNTIGNNFHNNTFGNYCQFITIFEGVQYCDVTGGVSNSRVRNAQILNGTVGLQSQRLTITFAPDQNATQIAGYISGSLRIWIAEDVVTGPSSVAATDRIAVFDGTTGKIIKDGGVTIGDLTNVQSDWEQTDSSEDDYIKNKPTNTSDFINDGSDGTSTYVEADDLATDLSGKADKVTGATNGNFAGLDSNGNLTDSGYDYTDFLSSSTVIPTVGTLNTDNTTAQTVSASESFGGSISLHKVAKTGTYSDLIGTPTLTTITFRQW